MIDFQAVEEIENILDQILQSGVHELDLLRQLYLFRAGMPFIQLNDCCTIENGTILHVSEADKARYISHANNAIANGRVIKFVPASGAATRMFKSILAVLDAHSNVTLALLEERAGKQSDYRFTLHFVRNIKLFAFFDSLKSVLERDGYNTEELLESGNVHIVLQYVVNTIGLGYAYLPKGLIEFHLYPKGKQNECRTAMTEHLIEALDYTLDSNNKAHVHFTFSPEYSEKARIHAQTIKELYSELEKVEITFSEQKQSTNTIAVTPGNEPFLTEDGLHFRPAGHGALLENLNDLHGDIIVIKNIDNVVPDRLKQTTYTYKRILCGMLVEVQEQIFQYIKLLNNKECSGEVLNEICNYVQKVLSWKPAHNPEHLPLPKLQEELLKILNRPLRVCGMVKNSGEPGGGPFIVSHQDGSQTLQIVESAQIDLADPEQKSIFDSSTHFNPVDVVCGVRDYQGKPFNLLQFRDDETGFISLKSSNGRELKALELPGLWNGSMAYWNTIFVEVPADTFHPVKTINDLLKPEHQP